MSCASESTAHFVLVHSGVNTKSRLNHFEGLLSHLGCLHVNFGPAGESHSQIIDSSSSLPLQLGLRETSSL